MRSEAVKDLPVWLFVAYGGGHVSALLPVARRVLDMGIARPIFLALTTAAAPARAAGFEVLGFADFLQPEDERAREMGAALAAALPVKAADPLESAAYLGLSYTDLEERLGVAEAALAYAEFGRQAFLPKGVLERVLDRLGPALVVATNSPRAERAAIETACARGIPCVCLLDLFGMWERELLSRADYADALCVLNDAVKRAFVAAGRPANQIHVTGNPAFDSVWDPAMKNRGASLRQAAGWDGLHVTLYASSPEPERIEGVAGTGDPGLPRRIEQALIEAVQGDPSRGLWVRRHPSEPPADELAALNHPRIRVSPHHEPLHAFLHACDEVVVTVSTVGVEANIAGRAVTQVRGSILDHLSPYVEMGIAQRELSVDSLAQGWSKLPPLTASGHGTAAPKQGAAERVVAVLRRVAERGDEA